MADLGERPGFSLPLFWVKQKTVAERKKSRQGKPKKKKKNRRPPCPPPLSPLSSRSGSATELICLGSKHNTMSLARAAPRLLKPESSALKGHFWVTLCLCFKTSPRVKPFKWNKFELHENKPLGSTHFHMNGFARGFVFYTEATGNSEMAYY